MKILIASDSFKDALDAEGVCAAIHKGIIDSRVRAEVVECPLADGGEGTARILMRLSGGHSIAVKAVDPLWRKRMTNLCFSPDLSTAFIDMAQVSGLQLLSPEERNPWNTTSYGTGELIRYALAEGVEKILIGIGGSATNDGGMGMATALGYEFRDNKGKVLTGEGGHLGLIHAIHSKDYWEKNKVPVDVLCDVRNPLWGTDGAAHVYARQKGADEVMTHLLDKGLRHLDKMCREHLGVSEPRAPGSGAAGGLGYGLRTFLGARLVSGADVVLDYANIDYHLNGADLVITGEGKIDGQTSQGKLISGVCARASQSGVPVIAFCGVSSASEEDLSNIGLEAAYTINSDQSNLEQALRQTHTNLTSTVTRIMKQRYG